MIAQDCKGEGRRCELSSFLIIGDNLKYTHVFKICKKEQCEMCIAGKSKF
jgi:hypothetical protein